MPKAKIQARREYNFHKLTPGATKTIRIPEDDPRAGLRALTAAYAFARRANDGVRKKADRIIFAGRTSPNGTRMVIHRVQ